jgi:hypothetical protein
MDSESGGSLVDESLLLALTLPYKRKVLSLCAAAEAADHETEGYLQKTTMIVIENISHIILIDLYSLLPTIS